MPIGLELMYGALFGGLVGGAFVLVWKMFSPPPKRLKGKQNLRPWLAYWAVFTPLLMGAIFVSQYYKPAVAKWFSTPIVATSPKGDMLTGKWWIDTDGTGHAKISNDTLSCTETYDGRSNSNLVQSTGTCSDGRTYELRVVRYGTANWKDRGEGVWRQGDRYGWYIFGWKARLAILTGGWIGLPSNAPTKSDFIGVRA